MIQSSSSVRADGALVAQPSESLSKHSQPAWLDRDEYPFESRFFEGAEGRLHYIDEGKGDPILFVHGTPSWSFEWRHQIRALRGEHRCVALDHLGFGLSDKPRVGEYRPVDHARRLLELVEHLGLQRITLVVHDFGGPIGLWLALEQPWRIRSIVVLNSWMWGMADDARVRRLSRFIASGLGRFMYLWLNASPRWLLPASFADRRKLTESARAHYLAPFMLRQQRTAPWVLGCELLGSAAFFDSLWTRRSALPAEPSFIWGMADPAVGTDVLRRWRDHWPRSSAVEVPGAGHFPQEEEPALVTAAIARVARGV